jgi:hypothetical protein
MQDVARRALSHYCLVLDGVADGLNLKYYPHRPSGSTRGVIVSLVGEDNPRLISTVNLATVLNTELDHALDELSRARGYPLPETRWIFALLGYGFESISLPMGL